MQQQPEHQQQAEPIPSSFRDPSGYIFEREGTVFRRVQPRYLDEYKGLMRSGLYAELTEAGLLIPHEECGPRDAADSGRQTSSGGAAALVLRPEQLDFVSYPYEWCFSLWKDAALATLEIQKRALKHGMTLKDASAYNIQFHRGRTLLIDTLSFETYHEGRPWTAYRQFCEHFLAPLALMARCDIRLGSLLRTHLNGIPLDLAARLLPARSRMNPHLLTHLFFQARLQKNRAGSASSASASAAGSVSQTGLRGLVDSLESAVRGLRWQPSGTVWADYYDETNYSEEAMTAKEQMVASFLERANPSSVWDFGANDARFSRLASAGRGIFTVAWDSDPAAVEKAYRETRERKDPLLLPLLQDLTNPTPDQGWAQQERLSLLSRGPADCVLALALAHHLAIGNNVPLTRISRFFADAARRYLIIEFVPKEDSQVKRLLAGRNDIFLDYYHGGFEAAFAQDWTIQERQAIPGAQRTLYLMRKKG